MTKVASATNVERSNLLMLDVHSETFTDFEHGDREPSRTIKAYELQVDGRCLWVSEETATEVLDAVRRVMAL